MKKVHIIGGGIVGLSSAWFLKEEGYDVTVIDRTDLLDGTSHGNAGFIVPSHFIPLASPGVISKGIKWMFNSKSPFFVKPRFDPALIQWLWKFYRSCSQENVDRSASILKDFNEQSKALYKDFSEKHGFNFCFEENGLLMLFKNSHAAEEEIKIAEKGKELGLEVDILNREEVQKKEPKLKTDVLGGIFYPNDAHLYPGRFIEEMVKKLKIAGIHFITNNAVTDIKGSNTSVDEILLSDGTAIKVEELVLSAGSWSAKLAKKLGLKILLQDGKGYSITLANAKLKPTYPTILNERKVAITPMGNDLRIGGTLEINNFNSSINQKRLEGILGSIPQYFPEMNIEKPDLKTVWHGFRPCTPDGIPYLGRSSKYNNLTFATGHAMMGMSLGPATGKLVSQIIMDQKTDLDISIMKPERF